MKYLDWLLPILHLLIGGAIAYPAFMGWWQRLRNPHLEEELKQRHRALAEAKLAAMYKEQLGESLLLAGKTQDATDQFEAALAADPRNRRA